MLGRDFAGTTASISNASMPVFTPTRPNMADSILEALNSYYMIDEKERQRQENERIAGLQQNLADAIMSGDEEAINKAYSSINPVGYIESLNDSRSKRELEEIKNKNSMDLEILKNQLLYNLEEAKSGWSSENQLKKAEYDLQKALAVEDIKSRNAYNLAKDQTSWNRESARDQAILSNALQQGIEEQKYQNQYDLAKAKSDWSSAENEKKMDRQLRNAIELANLENKNAINLENIRSGNTTNLEREKAGLKLAVDEISRRNSQTNAIKNYEYLVRNGVPEEQARAFAFPVNTEAIGNAIATGSLVGLGEAGQSAYDRERGKQLAQAEEKTRTKISNINNQIGNLTNLINNIQENPETVGFQSGPATAAARVAGLFGSKTAGDYLLKRGEVIRQLASIQNDLVNQARDAGQSGINTISEIRQITRGLNENSSMQEVVGALIAMKDSAQRLSVDLQNGTTNNPTNSPINIPTDEDAWGGI